MFIPYFRAKPPQVQFNVLKRPWSCNGVKLLNVQHQPFFPLFFFCDGASSCQRYLPDQREIGPKNQLRHIPIYTNSFYKFTFDIFNRSPFDGIKLKRHDLETIYRIRLIQPSRIWTLSVLEECQEIWSVTSQFISPTTCLENLPERFYNVERYLCKEESLEQGCPTYGPRARIRPAKGIHPARQIVPSPSSKYLSKQRWPDI